MSVLPLTFVRPPKYDEPEELLYWMVPPWMVVVPVNALLLPVNMRVPEPCLLKFPVPENFPETDSFAARLKFRVLPLMFVVPPKYEEPVVPLYWMTPPLMVVVPVKPLFVPEMVNVPLPDFMNEPVPLRKFE